jgi:hypothetical protein
VREVFWLSSSEDVCWLEPPNQPPKRLPAFEGKEFIAWSADVVGSGLLWLFEFSFGVFPTPKLKENWGSAAASEAHRASAMSTALERCILELCSQFVKD